MEEIFEALKRANDIVREKKNNPKIADKAERARASARAYYRRNAERICAEKRKYYAEHKAEFAEKRKTDDKHREYMREYGKKWRTDLKKAGIPLYTDEEKIRLNKARRERYHSDPVYREKMLRASKAWHSKNRRIKKILKDEQIKSRG